MEVLVLNGKNYVKASKAARDLGYTSDYVGQLCRSGQIDAHLVGRSWYVNADELSTHRVEKKRMSRVKAREQAHRSIEEHRRLSLEKTKNNYTNVAIRYETDDSELIPEVRKLDIESERTATAPRKETPRSARQREEEEEPYEVLNPGEKILMSGKLKIIDASEDAPSEDVTILTPKLVRHRKIEKENEKPESRTHSRILAIETEDESTKEASTKRNENKNISTKKDFLSRIRESNDSEEEVDSETGMRLPTSRTYAVGGRWMGRVSGDAQKTNAIETEEDVFAVQQTATRVPKTNIIPLFVIIAVLSALISAGSIMLEGVWSYSTDAKEGTASFGTSYKVSPKKSFEMINSI